MNRESHACEEVTHLVVGTFGMADMLRAALSPVADRIDLAMIVGPAARGEYVGLPDVDLLVVASSSSAVGCAGALEAADLAPILRNAERAIARRIALTLFDRATFALQRRKRARFPTGSRGLQRRLVLIGRFADIDASCTWQGPIGSGTRDEAPTLLKRPRPAPPGSPAPRPAPARSARP